MNKVYLIGRTTKSVDFKKASSGTLISNITLAVDRKYPDGDGNKITDFISLVCFGKTAELVNRYVQKGDKIAIVGELWTNTYENEKGEKKHSTSICVESIEFLEKKRETIENTQPELTEIDDASLPF